MECIYCKKVLSSKASLSIHQKSTRYCLDLQGKHDIKSKFVCIFCMKYYTNKQNLRNHQDICILNNPRVKELIDRCSELEKENMYIKNIHENLIQTIANKSTTEYDQDEDN